MERLQARVRQLEGELARLESQARADREQAASAGLAAQVYRVEIDQLRALNTTLGESVRTLGPTELAKAQPPPGPDRSTSALAQVERLLAEQRKSALVAGGLTALVSALMYIRYCG